MMDKRHSRPAARRGVSIAEMCIVLALISIISLTVVSFTAMISAHTKASAVRLSAMEDVDTVRAILDDWLIQMDGKEITVEQSSGKLSTTVDDQQYWACLEDGMLSLRFLGIDPISLQLKTVTGLQFDIMENENSTIYFCTMLYTIEHPVRGEVEQTFSFCIDPWKGETVG